MRTLATALLASVALLATAMPVTGAEPATTDADLVKFGMDAGSVAAQKAAGVAPDYGTFWIGPWTLSSGWGGPDAQLASMKSAGVTPAIHFYYWGDDITPSCVENGCYSSLHDSTKNRAAWEKLGTQLTDHLNAKMGGAPVVIFLESEFNKGGIQSYEPFDGYMADMANKIHAAYPNAIIVLGFGNWGSNYWGNFDRAAAASDMVGIQGMRGSTKQNVDGMMNLYEGLLAGVKTLQTKFPGTPIMLTDIAVSSYPEPGYLQVQADVLEEIFDNLGTLKAHGVEAMIYRSWRDSKMDPANYYGQAESHWGVAWQANGTQKAAGKVWVAGVKAERAGATPDVNDAPAAAFTAAGNALLVNVDASASRDPDGDALSYSWTFGDGSSATGAKAAHTYASAGTYTISLKVSDGALSATTSKAVAVTQAAPTSTSTTTSASGASVKVTPSTSSNEWWVQVGTSSTKTVSKVEAKVGSGAYTPLTKQSYGWAKSLHATKGTMVQFRVTSSDGQVATTAPQAWLVDMSAKTASFGGSSSTATATTSPPTSTTTTTTASVTKTTTAATTTTTAASTTTTASSWFKATFSPQSRTNNNLVEAGVTGTHAIAKVEAKVDSGAWTTLSPTSSGTYAKAMPAPDGAKVTFRATSAATGATYTSVAYTWG